MGTFIAIVLLGGVLVGVRYYLKKRKGSGSSGTPGGGGGGPSEV